MSMSCQSKPRGPALGGFMKAMACFNAYLYLSVAGNKTLLFGQALKGFGNYDHASLLHLVRVLGLYDLLE
jgi:hypothetical protein